jgi:hypothetical protein
MIIVSIYFLFHLFNSTRIVFLGRISSSLSAVPFIDDQEQKSLVFPHHRHGSSSINKNIDHNDNHRLFSHIIKAQRHSDPYSIKWITEGPHEVKDSGMYFSSYITFILSIIDR